MILQNNVSQSVQLITLQAITATCANKNATMVNMNITEFVSFHVLHLIFLQTI